MGRYFKLYAYFVRFSFMRAMAFRLDFYFRIVMDLIYYAVNLSLFKLLYLHTDSLGGWTEPQMMVFVSTYLVVDAISMTIFSNNLWWLPIFVNRGDLDYYLVRPVSSLFFVSLRDFAANSFVNLLMTFGIFAWALSRLPEPVAAWRLLLYSILVLNGAVLSYIMRMMVLIPVFWTHSARGFDQLYWSMSKIMERPDRIFTGWMRKVVIFVLPFGLMASFPARILVEGWDWSLMITLTLVSAAFFGLLVWFWGIGLRSYSSASS
jgi:ABC-2 type transport system permease protein